MFYENHKNKLLIASILLVLLGVVFIVYPAHSMMMLVRVTGVFLIILALMILIPTLRDRKYLGIRFGALIAVAAIIGIFGAVVLAKPVMFIEIFWIVLGVMLILDGIKNFMYLSVAPFKLISILLAVLSVICGVLIIVRPFGMGTAFTIMLGAFYAYSGAAGIFLNIAGKIQMKEKHVDSAEDADVVDVDFDDVEVESSDDVETEDEVKLIENADEEG